MNFKDKFDAIDTEAMTREELFAEAGVDINNYVAEAMKLMSDEMMEARAEVNSERLERLKKRIGELVAKPGDAIAESLRSMLRSKYPAVSFRNLDELTDEQVEEIAEDLKILEIMESEDE